MKLRWIRYGLEELKFVRSLNDLRNLTQKLSHLKSRLSGNPINDNNVPLCLQIEPTNYCNVNCICCSRERMERAKGYMDFGLFQKIIDDASEIGVKRVHLYLHGEPLLNSQIVNMIGHIKSKNLAFTIATNGMLLDSKKIEDILSSGVNNSDHFMFSILGHSKVVHEWIMRGVNHERVKKNLLLFLKLRKLFKLNGPVIETVFYQMPENEQERKQFYNYWHGTVDHVRICDKISEQFSRFKTEDNFLPPRSKTCRNLWERMTVFWNGDVTLCPGDLDGLNVFGNLKKKSIKELWNCEELLSIKKSHKENRFHDLSLCSNCDQ